MFTVNPAGYFLMKLPAQGLLMHIKTHGVYQVQRIGVIYRSGYRRSAAQVFTGKNKLLAKCFRKTVEGYVDVCNVLHTFLRIHCKTFEG